MIITHYGRLWNRELTDWATVKATGRLPGRANDAEFDVFSLRGIYLLHDHTLQPVYIGQAGSGQRGLGPRLLEHGSDHLWGSWHYYSWFAVAPWKKDEEPGEISVLLNEFEDLFIYLLAPRLNRKKGTAEGVTELFQIFRNGEGLFNPFRVYSDIESLSDRIGQLEARIATSGKNPAQPARPDNVG